jgi:predicted transcriptional regulator
MAATTQIELSPEVSEEIRHLAEVLHQTPQDVASQVLMNGLHALRRYAFYEQNAGKVLAEDGLAILRKAGRNNPPDPGDELPDDLKYLLSEGRA